MSNLQKCMGGTSSQGLFLSQKASICDIIQFVSKVCIRGERERLFGSREREGKLKITFSFYGKGTGIRKCYGKGREI